MLRRINSQSISYGFSLIEVMITLVIVGILASIAIPSYQSSVLKSKRNDGETLILEIAARMDRALYNDGSYSVDLTKLGFTNSSNVESEGKYYKASVKAATAGCPITSCYVVRLTPQGGQIDDGIIELHSNGLKKRDKNGDGDVADTGEDSWN